MADVDLSRLQCPEPLRQAAERNTTTDFVRQLLEQIVAGA